MANAAEILDRTPSGSRSRTARPGQPCTTTGVTRRLAAATSRFIRHSGWPERGVLTDGRQGCPPGLDGEQSRQLAPRSQAELAVGAGQVGLDRLQAQKEVGGAL